MDGYITVPRNDNVSITISLDPGGFISQSAEWWVYANSPQGNFSFVYPIGWLPGDYLTLEYPIFELSSFSVFNRVLSSGNYTFYFTVDDNLDGTKDEMWNDSVNVLVE
jgi:hypothetical protein